MRPPDSLGRHNRTGSILRVDSTHVTGQHRETLDLETEHGRRGATCERLPCAGGRPVDCFTEGCTRRAMEESLF